MKPVEQTLSASQSVPLLVNPEAAAELAALGVVPGGDRARIPGLDPVAGRDIVPRTAITDLSVLNEAYDYALPSSFSRGLRIELGTTSMLMLSGTASIDDGGRTLYPGNFEAQCIRTFRNLTVLLAAEGASWHDIVRTSCYLRDIERDYDTFNQVRTHFMCDVLGLDPLPASTGIQARLCRSDLLVEIEAIAMVPATTNGAVAH